MKKGVVVFLLVATTVNGKANWGFFAHQEINRLAVFTLPAPLIKFYKAHLEFIVKNAVNPDKRRYIINGEAPRHYIDLDVYGDSALFKLPENWFRAIEKYTEDTLLAYGIVPWHINRVKNQLTSAFSKKDIERILKLSADLGHYIGDSNVPLHTTENYNGQFSGQKGIHGFWESRLPELFFEDYSFWVGAAIYEPDPQQRAWEAVENANKALDSVLLFESRLNLKFDEDRKYSLEAKGNSIRKVYSKEYSKSYHKMLSGMVERQMQRSVKMVGDFWYTCWVDAGKPDLDDSNLPGLPIKNKQDSVQKLINSRPHEN